MLNQIIFQKSNFDYAYEGFEYLLMTLRAETKMLRMGCSPKLLNSDATVDEIEIRYNRITAWCSKEEKLKILNAY